MTGLIHHKLYFKITRDRLDSAQSLERSVKGLRLDPSPWIKLDLIDEILSNYFESVVESIVFSGLTVEAFINSYAMARVSKPEFKRLNRLSLREKWLEIPSTVTGKKIPEDSQAVLQLAELVKSRNNLVHYKIAVNDPSEYYSLIGSMLMESDLTHALPLTMQAESNIRTIRLLIAELKLIDSTVSDADLLFDKNENRWFELWSHL
jgi:hypothetical protein